jgi:hypothetical protein
MRNRRRNWILKRFALAFAVAAVAAPTAQARIDEQGGAKGSSDQQYIAGVTDFPKAVNHAAKIGGTPVGLPHAGLNDYLRSRDGIENVRLAPRSTARSFDGIENVRVEPRTVDSPSLVASPGFDWSDAGIGAGVALLLVALSGGALLASRNVKPQTA